MSEPFIGEIRMVSFNYAPRNWAFCNGQLLSINTNQALFSLLGTTYGGNGVTTFALPDLRGRTPLHWGTSAAGGTVTQGQVGGEASHVLTISEVPTHTHQAVGSSLSPTQSTPLGGLWAAPNKPAYGAAPDTQMRVLNPVGASQAHENMQPYLVVHYVIALVGVYPSRN